MKKNAIFRVGATVLGFFLSMALLPAQQTTAGPPAMKKKPLVVTVFNTGTQLPNRIFTLPIHPGLSAGTAFDYNKNPKNQWFQTARVAVSWHRYVQTAVQLYSEVGYRRAIWRGVGAELRSGAGYLHSIPATELFEWKDGTYKPKSRFGRPQVMATGTFGLSYQLQHGLNPPRFFVDYQFLLQMPFVKSYVPLLPNTALHVGAAVPFFK